MAMRRIDPGALGLQITSISANEAHCLCPFHADHSPSASINLQTGLFHCFACGYSANAKQLAKALGGDVVWTLAPLRVTSRAVEDFDWILANKLAIDNPYLQSRRVGNDLVKRFEIRELQNGVAIPLKDFAGETIGVLVRRTTNEPPRYLFYGTRTPGWPMEVLKQIRPRERLVIVEGVFGVLRACSAGVKAFATLSASSPQITFDVLRGVQNRVVLFDNDFAGKVGAIKHLLEGAAVFVPGGEADELTIEQWQSLERLFKLTRNVNDIFETERDKKPLFDAYRRIIKKSSYLSKAGS